VKAWKETIVAPVEEEFEQRLTELVAYGRRLVEDGLVIGTAGNLSIRMGDRVAITPSGIPYDVLTVDDMCILDLSGKRLHGHRTPSTETTMHLAIYNETDAGAVVHTHSPAAVAVGTVVDVLPAVHYGILRLGGHTVRVTDYQLFGSEGIAAAALAACRGGRRAALLRNHGAITYGPTLAAAYDAAQLLEWLADVYWRARLLGEPRIISDEELDEHVSEAERRRYLQETASR
jgi:L-fuculose-phosphate aldolase